MTTEPCQQVRRLEALNLAEEIKILNPKWTDEQCMTEAKDRCLKMHVIKRQRVVVGVQS